MRLPLPILRNSRFHQRGCDGGGLRLDVSPREMPPEGREELAAALAAMKQYLLQLEAIRQKLLVLSADVEMQLDMYQMPEIYGPPEFFGIFADKEETP